MIVGGVAVDAVAVAVVVAVVVVVVSTVPRLAILRVLFCDSPLR